jgi:hypothetical protein
MTQDPDAALAAPAIGGSPPIHRALGEGRRAVCARVARRLAGFRAQNAETQRVDNLWGRSVASQAKRVPQRK